MSTQNKSSIPPASGDVLVKAENVGKIFCRNLKRSLFYGVRDGLSDLTGIPSRKYEADGTPILRRDEFWSNRGVSFQLRRGECLGLIGRNGAGKTTLLKMLNGLIKPDTGTITMRGRVGALIALGAGFNPILTGRENIYVNASVLGISRAEVERKINDIIEFAEIGEFIDSPVQTYSSGMQVRLGFAVATAMEPDILIIDEVLAVGDTTFKVRCYNKIRDIASSTAVVFVSHSMFDIAKICSRVIVMDKGIPQLDSDARSGIQLYNRLNLGESDDTSLKFASDKSIRDVRLEKVSWRSAEWSSDVDIHLVVDAGENIPEMKARIVFFDAGDMAVAEWDSLDKGISYSLKRGLNDYRFKITDIRLIAGVYRVVVVLSDMESKGYHLRVDQGISVNLTTKNVSGTPYRI